VEFVRGEPIELVADRLIFVMAEEGAEVEALPQGADEGWELVLDSIDQLVVGGLAAEARMELGLHPFQSPASPHSPRKMLDQLSLSRHHIADNEWHQRLLGLSRRMMRSL
jgi:hypothetical protein